MTDSNSSQTITRSEGWHGPFDDAPANQPDAAAQEPLTSGSDSTIIQPPAEPESPQFYDDRSDERSDTRPQVEKRYKPVDESELNRLRELFEEPQSVKKFLTETRISAEKELPRYHWKQHILLLIGKQSTGKMAAALFIADTARKTGNLQVLQYLDVRPPDLQTLIATVSSVRNAILIVNGISLKSLTAEARDIDESLKHVAKTLQQRNSLLILTCHELDQEKMERWSAVQTLTVNEATPDTLRDVISKYLKYYHARAQEESESEDLFWNEIKDSLSPDKQLLQELAQLLRTPSQVNTFFEQLLRTGGLTGQSRNLPDQLKAIAEGIGKTDRHTVRAWFRQLPPPTRLYAMLQHLFRGLAGDDVYVIYRHCLGVLFSHPHEGFEQGWKGIEELDEDSRILRRNSNSISFELPIYEQEVEQQIESYRHHLWMAMREKVVPLAEEYRERTYWQLRMNLGHAIGRLGFYDWAQCRELLHNGLSLHARTPMRALCGHIISELLARIQHPGCTVDSKNRAESILAGLEELMVNWVTEKTAGNERRWTATAVLWRVFNLPSKQTADSAGGTKLQSIALGVLQEVSEQPPTVKAQRPDPWQRSYFQQTGSNPDSATEYPDFDVVTETFMRLFLLQPEKTIDLLVKWLQAGFTGSAQIGRPLLSTDEVTQTASKKSGRSKTRETDPAELLRRGHCRTITVLKAICELLQLESSFGMQSISIRRQLLRLAEPCLSIIIPEGDGNLQQVTRQLYLQPIMVLAKTLEGWLQELTDDPSTAETDASPDSIRPAILQALLPAIDRSRDVQRSEFVTRVYQSWMNSSSATVRNVGRELLARATFAEARCMDQSGQQKVLLVLDSSSDNRSMQLINDIAVSIAEQLRLESDVVWGRLGSSQVHSSDPQHLQEMRRPQTCDRPRLIMPLLEAVKRKNLHYALILTTEEPDDLKDANTQYEHRPLYRFCGLILSRRKVNHREDLVGALLETLHISLFRNEINASNLRNVLETSRAQMEQSLLLRDDKEWRKALSTFLPGDREKISPAIVCSYVRNLLATSEAQQCTRQLHTCLQWLLLRSCETAVSLLAEHSSESPVGPCSRMLIRLMLAVTRNWDERRKRRAQVPEVCLDEDGYEINPAENSEAPQGEPDPPADFVPALRLGSLMIGQSDSPDGMQDYLECLNLLWTSESWQREILRCPEVLAAIDAVSDATGGELKQWLEKRLQSSRDSVFLSMALRQLKLGRRLRSHDFPSQLPHFAVLYDPADDVCCRIAALTCKLMSSDELKDQLRLLVFPLGSSFPLVCPDGKLPAIDPQEAARLPALIGPAVEKLQRHRLSRLLLVTRRRPVDLSDVAEELMMKGYFCHTSEQVEWNPGWNFIQMNDSVLPEDDANKLETVLQQCIEDAV